MIKKLLHNFSKGALLYVRIKSDWLSVRDIKSNHYYEDIPISALKKESRNEVMAVGFEARELVSNNDKYRLVNGFEDREALISNRHAAEGTLKYFMDSVIKKGLIHPPIIAILHPTSFTKNNFSKDHAQVLKEITCSAGAVQAHVWAGRELMYEEILNGDFPPEGIWRTEAPSWTIKTKV
jgi:hypothetical protein